MMRFGASAGAVALAAALLVALSGCQKQEGRAEQAGKEIDQAVRQAGESIDKATAKAGEKLEQAGEKMQDAAKRGKK